LKKEVFNYIENGEELVNEPFRKMIKVNELDTYKYNGFWASMDTFKDKQELDDLHQKGDPPWQVWNHGKQS
jgi:glucose-1-phosphate cytidylyltransferase